jgi:hypothetical protein
MNLKEVNRQCVDWIHLVQDRGPGGGYEPSGSTPDGRSLYREELLDVDAKTPAD